MHGNDKKIVETFPAKKPLIYPNDLFLNQNDPSISQVLRWMPLVGDTIITYER